MRFAPPELLLDCAAVLEGDEHARQRATHSLAARAAELVQRRGFVLFRLGRLRLSIDDSRRLARTLAEAVRVALVVRGAPPELRVEHDRAQKTHVPKGYSVRTLLPHHDGQHCSYLTPSREDDPTWLPDWREFAGSSYTTTRAHKLYQGVFVAEPGDALSVTTYYDWLDILATVSSERSGADPGGADPWAVARWLGHNLRSAIAGRSMHSSSYPSIGSMLGVSEPMWRGLAFHHAETELSQEDRERYPMAVPLAASCPCGDCGGDVARLFCHQLLTASGRTWKAWRQRWEVLAPSERFDLVLGHNLTMLHGGLAGGPGRVLQPLCLVVDDPRGDAYERWLAASWRRRFPAEVG